MVTMKPATRLDRHPAKLRGEVHLASEIGDAGVLESGDEPGRADDEHHRHQPGIAVERCGRNGERGGHHGTAQRHENVQCPRRVEMRGLWIGLLDQRQLEAEGRCELDDGDDGHRHRDQAEIGRNQQPRKHGGADDSDRSIEQAKEHHPRGAARHLGPHVLAVLLRVDKPVKTIPAGRCPAAKRWLRLRPAVSRLCWKTCGRPRAHRCGSPCSTRASRSRPARPRRAAGTLWP